MIVYNDIYEALIKERYSEQLQLLPKKFIMDVAEYIRDKRKLSQQQVDLFSEEILKVQKQLENAQSIFKELMLLRKKKILGLVFVASETGISKRDFENMLDFEKDLFDKLILAVQENEKKINQQMVSFSDGTNGNEVEMSLLLFVDDVDDLVGPKGEQIGPFKKGDVSNLPKQVADILIEDKKAELIED